MAYDSRTHRHITRSSAPSNLCKALNMQGNLLQSAVGGVNNYTVLHLAGVEGRTPILINPMTVKR